MLRPGAAAFGVLGLLQETMQQPDPMSPKGPKGIIRSFRQKTSLIGSEEKMQYVQGQSKSITQYI